MTLKEARELLGLGLKATRKEIQSAYHQAARRWHPDRATPEGEAECRARMQQINAAYQVVLKFIEDYQYDLVEPASPRDYQKWWYSRFGTGVWEAPPRDEGDEQG